MTRDTYDDKVVAPPEGGLAEVVKAIKGSLLKKVFLATFVAFVGAIATSLFPGPLREVVIRIVNPPPPPPTTDSIKKAADEVSQGTRYSDRGDYPNALEAFKRATAMDPSNSVAWANLGAAAGMLGRSTESVQAYDRALAIDPESWLAHYNFGCQLLRMGKSAEALEHISRGVNLARHQMRTEAERKAMLERLHRDDATRELHDDPHFKALFTTK